MKKRHCATCRCPVTFTGQIAMLLESEPGRLFTPVEIVDAINYEGNALFTLLATMVNDGKIRKVARRELYGANPPTDDLREEFSHRA